MEIPAFLSGIPMDYFLLLAAFGGLFVFSLYGGNSQAGAIVFALLAALVLNDLIMGAHGIGETVANIAGTDLGRLAVFGAMFAAAYIVIRIMLGLSWEAGGYPLTAVAGAVSALAMILVVWHMLPYSAALWSFAPHIAGLFAPQYAFWWVLGSLALLTTTRRGW